MNIRPTDDHDTIRAIDRATFGTDLPLDVYQLGKCKWWVAQGARKPSGFVGGYHVERENVCVIERYGSTAHGKGLGVRLLETFVRWARKKKAAAVVTYTLWHNTPSNICMLKAGFTPWEPVYKAQIPGVLYWRRDL